MYPRLVVATLIVAGLVARAPEARALQHNPFPAPTGPFRVGRTQFDWVDSSRVDLESRLGRRRLVVWVWYPAAPRETDRRAAWLPGAWRDMHVGFQNRLSRLYARPGDTVRAPRTRTDSAMVHSFVDPPATTASARHPVLMFAAGWGVLPLGYSNVIEDLVSHGYIVAGVVFTYYSPYSIFLDGDVAGQHEFAIDLPGAPPRYYRGPVPPAVIRIQTDDVIFALDQLQRVNEEGTSAIRGRMDFDRVGALGHSIGATVAMRAAKEDSRIKSVVSYDGNLAHFADDPVVPRPTLWISAGIPAPGVTTTPANRGELLTEILRNAPVSYNVIIAGTTHNFPGDSELASGTRPANRIDPVRALRVTKDYTRAFFDEQLRSMTGSFFVGASPEYPEVTLDIVNRGRR